jgi:hypothetical protein
LRSYKFIIGTAAGGGGGGGGGGSGGGGVFLTGFEVVNFYFSNCS